MRLIKKVAQAFVCAGKGFALAVKGERNFRLEIIFILISSVLGVLFRVSLEKWLALVLAFGTLLCTELLNTAIEKLCDYITKTFDHKIGAVKDIAAAAVLCVSVAVIVVWCIVFVPEIIGFLKGVFA